MGGAVPQSAQGSLKDSVLPLISQDPVWGFPVRTGPGLAPWPLVGLIPSPEKSHQQHLQAWSPALPHALARGPCASALLLTAVLPVPHLQLYPLLQENAGFLGLSTINELASSFLWSCCFILCFLETSNPFPWKCRCLHFYSWVWSAATRPNPGPAGS